MKMSRMVSLGLLVVGLCAIRDLPGVQEPATAEQYEIVQAPENAAADAEAPRRVDAAAIESAKDEPLPLGFVAADGTVALVDDKVTLPDGLTVLSAVEHIVKQRPSLTLNYQELITNEVEVARLKTEKATFHTTDEPVLWERVLREVVAPHGLDFVEDDGVLRLGPSARIQERMVSLEAEKLTRNRTPVTCVNPDGVFLILAIRDIQSQAGININFDWMDPQDRVTQEPEKVDAVEIDKQAAAPGKKTTYTTPKDQPVHWRIALREVLTPHGYAFAERDGVVRIAKPEMIRQWETEAINAKPLIVRFVRVHHANPEVLVTRLQEMKLLKHAGAFVAASRPKDDDTKTFTGGQAGIAIGSGTQIGASDVGGGGAFGGLSRPRTPPGIVIADIEENLDLIETKIKMMDVREKQVLIEALVLDVGDDAMKELGVTWKGNVEGYRGLGIQLGGLTAEAQRGDGWGKQNGTTSDWSRVVHDRSVLPMGDSVLPRVNSSVTTDEGTRGSYSDEQTGHRRSTSFTGVLGPLDLKAVLSLLQTHSDVQTLASPVIVIGDHSEAVIQVGRADPIATSKIAYLENTANNGNNVAEEVEWQILMTGVTLWVSPEVTEDGDQVRLSVHPQLTEASKDRVEGPNGTSYPTVTTRELDTRVTVPSGRTLMLGGLITSTESKAVEKVPFLGDIPLIGRLFRKTITINGKSNLIILIRPTILDDEAPDSGFETPAMKLVDPLLEGTGRTLKAPKIPDPMRDKERTWFGWGKKKPVETNETEGAATAVIVEPEAPEAPAPVHGKDRRSWFGWGRKKQPIEAPETEGAGTTVIVGPEGAATAVIVEPEAPK